MPLPGTGALARWSFAALAVALLCASPAQADTLRRFAIIAGNNEGGEGTRNLQFATGDATRIHEILIRVGGVAPGDAVLLLDRDAPALIRAFEQLEPRLAEAASRGEKPALIVYYSGHAKDGALRLGQTRIALEEVRRRMSQSAAEVRIGIFDSCRSGALTRTKGARRAPAFDVDAGSMRAAKGLVILTSSAADEDSQEADELSGSYFSHHLASGLLGSADASGDGRVSLAEAYAYAYDRTVADTVDTAAGAQHPTFSYDLAGNGDVILTDFAARHEGVLIPSEAPAGSYLLVSGKGLIAAEITKVPSLERRVALEPGSYKVKRRLPDRLRIGDLQILPGATAVLLESMLHDAPFSDDPVKGGIRRRYEPPSSWSLSLQGSYQSFFDGALFPSSPLLGLELDLRDYLRAGFVIGFDGAIGGANARLTLTSKTLPYRFSELGLGVSLRREWGETFVPYLGGRLGAIVMGRKFEEPGLPSQSYFAMTPGLFAGFRWNLAGALWVGPRARLHYLYYNVDRTQSLGYIEGSVLVSYDL